MIETATPLRNQTVSVYATFAAFGAFWGAWGASIPRVRDQAGVSVGQLGFALVFVGAGALPAMLLVGRALDRWGLRVGGPAVIALGVAGAGTALTAVDLSSLCIGLTLIGAASGATDVAMNSVVGRAEKASGRPLITRAHGVFSTCVVLGGLGTGLTSALSQPLAVPFTAVAVLCLIAGTAALKSMASDSVMGSQGTSSQDSSSPDRSITTRVLLIGVLGALALACENAHQSWSAVFAHDELHSGPGSAAVAPAVFAATVAVTRFCIAGLKPSQARSILRAGTLAAALGSAVVAVAPTLAVAVLGLVVAAVGTAVLFPVLVGIVSRSVDETHRGRAMSVLTTVSYLGFLLSPGYVGMCSDMVGLRGAMTAVGALGIGMFVLVPVLLRKAAITARTG